MLLLLRLLLLLLLLRMLLLPLCRILGFRRRLRRRIISIRILRPTGNSCRQRSQRQYLGNRHE